MTKFPLVCQLDESIMGDNYVARVNVRGRALAVEEDDGIWMYGVYPGGLAAGGKTLEGAHLRFRETFKAVLVDIMADGPTFEEFERRVREYVGETDDVTVAEWNEAVAQVRAGKLDTGKLDLPRTSADSPVTVNVLRIALAPEANTVALDAEPSMAA